MPYSDPLSGNRSSDRADMIYDDEAAKSIIDREKLAQCEATYRLIYASSEVRGLPDVISVSGVNFSQTDQPITTQKTYIRQLPGWEHILEKSMHQGLVEVGAGLHLTVAEMSVGVDADHLTRDMDIWHARVQAAAGLLAAALDERVAYEELGEDVILRLDGRIVAVIDREIRVRHFAPFMRANAADESVLQKIQSTAVDDDPAHASLRWYLSAVQRGPTADAAVSLMIALESLAPSPSKSGGRYAFDPRVVEAKIEEAGGDVASVEPTVGRLLGLRADIVHKGLEDPPLLRDGYYVLEWIVRLLIRHRYGVPTHSWPVEPVGTVRPAIKWIE